MLVSSSSSIISAITFTCIFYFNPMTTNTYHFNVFLYEFVLLCSIVEDWLNHQSKIHYRKNNDNKTMNKCRKQYNYMLFD